MPDVIGFSVAEDGEARPTEARHRIELKRPAFSTQGHRTLLEQRKSIGAGKLRVKIRYDDRRPAKAVSLQGM